MNDFDKYIDFLKFSIDDSASVPACVADLDWMGMLNFASEQSIVGVLFHGIQKLDHQGPRPDKYTIINWFSAAEQVKATNMTLNRDAAAITYRLWKDGFKGCLLKGQGNALMYPDPYMRQSGDIDLWLDKDRLEILKYVRKFTPDTELNYHHVEFPVLKDSDVEIHYTPSFCGNLYYDRRLQRYFASVKKKQYTTLVDLPGNAGKVCVPTDDFNRIFQLSHIMHHFFFEGIGLRQMIDYYYLLKRGFSDKERDEFIRVVKYTNMYKFAGAVMYVMEKIGLDRRFMPVEPNMKVGSLLFTEVMRAGNFGFTDKKYQFGDKSRLGQFVLECFRNMHFAVYFPAETIFGRPIWRVWHQFFKWKIRKQLEKE